jgi:hypothetical protein
MMPGAKLAIVMRRTTTFRVITPVEQIVEKLVSQGKTGALTIHMSQGGICNYEWTEKVPDKK